MRLVIDDREYDDQVIRIPDGLSSENISELDFNVFYDKNKEKSTSFINQHESLLNIRSLSIARITQDVNLNRFNQLRELSVCSDYFNQSEFPRIDQLVHLERLDIHYMPPHGLDLLFKDISELPMLKEVRWSNFDAKEIKLFCGLKNISTLDINLAVDEFGESLEVKIPDLPAMMSNLKVLKIDVDDSINISLPDDLSGFCNLDMFHINYSISLDLFLSIKRNFPAIKIKTNGGFDEFERLLKNDRSDPVTVELHSLKLKEIPLPVFEFDFIKSLSILNQTELDLSGLNHLKTDEIEVLNLDCHLRELPAAIAKMKNLRVLSISGFMGTTNRVEEIPDWIGELSKLEELHLAGNLIKSIPDSIARCTELKTIFLSHDDGDRVHSNPICHDEIELRKAMQMLPLVGFDL